MLITVITPFVPHTFLENSITNVIYNSYIIMLVTEFSRNSHISDFQSLPYSSSTLSLCVHTSHQICANLRIESMAGWGSSLPLPTMAKLMVTITSYSWLLSQRSWRTLPWPILLSPLNLLDCPLTSSATTHPSQLEEGDTNLSCELTMTPLPPTNFSLLSLLPPLSFSSSSFPILLHKWPLKPANGSVSCFRGD